MVDNLKYTVNFATMIGSLEKKPSIRIAGYLEKRGKMRMLVSRWKRWWFVLEGRLLLYYKSQMEYLNLSPCRGSLNMGLAASVQPNKGLELTVVTRSQRVTLRASNRAEHEQWLQSLLDAMALPNSVNNFGSRPVMHFRYASQEYQEQLVKKIKSFRCPSFATLQKDPVMSSPECPGSGATSSSSSHASGLHQTSPDKCLLRRVLSDSRTLLQRPRKRNSVRLSKIAFSDTSIPNCTQTAHPPPTEDSEKCQSMQELRNSMCGNEDDRTVERLADPKGVVINGSRESKLSNSIKIELNLEDLGSTNGVSVSEKTIGNIKITLDGCAIYGSRELYENGEFIGEGCKAKNKSSCHNNRLSGNHRLNPQLNNCKEAKSDSNLAVTRRIRVHSVSCENVQALDRSIGPSYQDTSAKVEFQQIDNRDLLPRKPTKKRSNSILSRFFDNKEDLENGKFERMGTIRKRLSFLRSMWKKNDKKAEEDTLSNDYESIPVVTELPSPEVEKAEELLASLGGQDVCGPEPEPPPDYDMSLPEEEDLPPTLPPRQGHRPPSPWHDVPKNNKPVMLMEDDTHPPPLPLKRRQKVLVNGSVESPGNKKLDKLDTLLAELSDVVQQVDVSSSASGIDKQKPAVESDYDVPRSHFSLVANMEPQPVHLDSLTATHFLCTTPLVDLDSLDPVTSRLDAEMTPDSLECDSPWSLTHATLPSHSSHSESMSFHFFASDEKLFPDSLNT